MNKEELNKILFSLEDVARKHTIEVCDNGSMIEFMSAQIDELRLNNYSAKILLNYINKQKEVLDKIKEYIKEKGLYSDYGDRASECEKDILELLEEIEKGE